MAVVPSNLLPVQSSHGGRAMFGHDGTQGNESQAMIRQRLLDKTYIGLLALGPLFWLAYYIYAHQAPMHVSWPLSAPMRFALLVLIYPIFEEIVFRGLVQEGLARWLPQRLGILSLANILTSVVFAALHLVQQSPLWALGIFFPSLVFGFSKERYLTLWAPIILHGWYNLGFVWIFHPG